MSWFFMPTADGPSEGLPPNSHPRPLPDAARDASILDAYSMAVIHVVDTVGPAVISLTGRGGEASVGSGSGFIVSPEGYAVTNSHVVAGRQMLVAETAEGDRVDAQVIGDDPATDLALLRLAARDLPHVTIGDSAQLRVGQLVIAMGSPLGLHATVSTGIVSATGRSLRSQAGRMIENVVQHSAPINPGNSGGPLLDSRGQVVGVNTAIIFMAQGIGFAVPSGTAQWVTTEILTHGAVRRRQLGIVATPVKVARQTVRALDLLTDQAVGISDILPHSPAERAGLRPDDVLVAMNDRIVETADDVHRLLALFPWESPIELQILRADRRMEVTLPPGG